MYAGSIGIVDLASGTIEYRGTGPYAERMLGGRGINAELLFELAPRGCDPLGPENVLIFGVGILCGMPGPDAQETPFGRLEVTSKSPETGYLGSANMGGSFGLRFKGAGFDNVAVRGCAETPVLLYLEDGQAQVLDASDLWGKDTYETQAILKQRFGSDAEVACIGPAGERLVRFASVRHGSGHAATRTGLGCVMGSKRLKAVVARSGRPVAFAKPAACSAAVGELYDEMTRHWYHHELIFHGLTRMVDEYKHWWATDTGAPAAIRSLRDGRAPARTGCVGCPTPCMESYPNGDASTTVTCAHYIYPSYAVRNRDPQVLLDCVDFAQRQGMDIVSAMSIISWLMQLRELGTIAPADTDGLDLSWGNGEAITQVLSAIARREGIGDVLADGMRAAARHFGAASAPYANHVKGLPFYGLSNPDIIIASKDVALSLATSPRADTMRSYLPAESLDNLQDAAEAEGVTGYARAVHQRPEDVDLTADSFSKSSYDGKAEQAILGEDMIVINDMLGVCKLQSWHLGNIENERLQSLLVSEASGRPVQATDLVARARRVMQLERAFNVREGMRRDADILPDRLFGRPTGPESRYPGATLDRDRFEALKSRYYRLRGWDSATGIPTRETLEAEGLAHVATELAAAGVWSAVPESAR